MNVSLKQLAKRSGEKYHTLQHWCKCGLFEFERQSRERSFPLLESMMRIRFIREQQKNKEFTSLKVIQERIKAKEHLKGRKQRKRRHS